jgi:WD40 repeat protein
LYFEFLLLYHFLDFIQERNELAKRVFPYLKTYCATKGLDFQVIDMRWGVSDMNVSLHQTSEVCLNEIELCQKMSLGPSFIALIGNRYGYQPLPAKIEASLFEVLCSLSQQQHMDCSLLREWYTLDKNSIPPVYQLQSIQSRFPNFYSMEHSLQVRDRVGWDNVFSKLQMFFRSLVCYGVEKGHITDEQALIFKLSVTEEEITHGLLKVIEPQNHCLCYHRKLDGILKNLDDPSAGQYMDMKPNLCEIDQEAQDLLSELIWKKIPCKLSQPNMRMYTVPWINGGIDSANTEHASYLHTFCEHVQKDLCSLIDRAIESAVPSQGFIGLEELMKEVHHHASFCKSKCESFCGREYELLSIKSFLHSESGKPLILYGPSGSGKTSVMAKVASVHRSWFGQSSVVMVRFLGTSPQSTFIFNTISSICYQLCSVYAIDDSRIGSMHSSEIFQFFHSLIQDILPKKVESHLLLLFDSVDQLSEVDGAHAMNWLPKSFPHNIHIVLSVLPSEYNCLHTLQSVLPFQECYLEIQPMLPETAKDILANWLKQAGRTLGYKQFEFILAAFTGCPQPLFLRLLFHQAVQWKSYTDCNEIFLPGTTADALVHFFHSVEKSYGKVLVFKSLGYLTASRSGLSEAELEDVLSLDDEVLNSVYQYWDPPSNDVVRLPSLLWSRIRYFVGDYLVQRSAGGKSVLTWFHRQFVEAAKKRYLESPKDRKACHTGLASFFTGVWSDNEFKPITLSCRNLSLPQAARCVAKQPNKFSEKTYNLRKLDELPFHLIFCESSSKSKSLVFCKFSWILDKLHGLSVEDLVQDYGLCLSVASDPEVSIIRDTLLLSAYRLKAHPMSLAEQLLGRLNDLQNDLYPNIFILLQEARHWIHHATSFQFLPLNQSLVCPGGPLVTTLSGHAGLVQSVSVSPDRNLMVSCSKGISGGGTFNIWDIQSLDCVQITHSLSISGLSSQVIHVICNDYIIGACDCNLVLWNVVTGGEAGHFTFNDRISCLAANAFKCYCVVGLVSGSIYVLAVPGASVLCAMQDLFTVEIQSISFVNKGQWFLTVPVNGTPMIFDSHTLTLSSSLRTIVNGVSCVAVGEGSDPQSNYLAIAFKDGDIFVWNLPQLSTISTLQGHTKNIQCMSFVCEDLSHPTLVSGSLDGSARVWNPQNEVCKFVLVGHSSAIWCVSPLVGGLFVTGSKDDTLKVWNISSCDCVQTLEGHSSWISCVNLVRLKGEIIVVSGSNDKTLKIWKAYKRDHLQLPQPVQHTKQPGCIVTTPFGLAISGAEDALKIWDLRTGHCLFTYTTPISAICFGKPNLLFAAASNNCQLFCWNLSNIRSGNATHVKCSKGKTAITDLCFLGTGYVITSHKCGAIQLWSVDLKLLGTYERHSKEVKCVIFSQDELLMVSGSLDTTVCLWKAPKLSSFALKPVSTFVGHQKTVGCVSITDKNDKIISGSDDHTLRIWCTQSEACLKIITYGDSVKCLVLTTAMEGCKVIAGAHCAKEQLRLWDATSGQLGYDFCGHTHAVMCLQAILDNKLLLSGSRDGTIRLWETDSGQPLASFDLQSQVKYMSVEELEDHCYVAATLKMGPVAFFRVHFPREYLV